MSNRFVIDTVGFINYFNNFFQEDDKLSKAAREIITRCFDNTYPEFKLIIPAVVFIEVFKKFLTEEEISKKFYYEVFSRIKECEDVEVKPVEKEVLQIFSRLETDPKLELHDKIVYSSAIQLECPLITNDSKITKANSKLKVVQILF